MKARMEGGEQSAGARTSLPAQTMILPELADRLSALRFAIMIIQFILSNFPVEPDREFADCLHAALQTSAYGLYREN